MINIGTFLQDRYLIGKQIGSGGMGAVYVAIDQRFESRVAIKETYYNDEALSEAFEREARLLNNLHHPVLPHVSDFFIEDGTHFLVMEYIEGEDLSEILKSGSSLPAADVLRWANQLLDALDFLHSQNPPIIHRDIKPHNLKITPRGDIVLLDFGLAKFESDDQGARSVFGYSRTYSPLEQIEGTGTDVRSDIFSLGATGYYLLTGRPPIDALKRAAAIISGNGDPLETPSVYNPEINSALDHILLTALALDPNERYSSALAMRTAIEYAIDDDSESSTKNITDENQASSAADEEFVNEKGFAAGFPALAAFAVDTVDNPAQTETLPKINVTVENSRELPHAESFTATVLDNSPTYKKLVPAAFLLFILAGGLIAWLFAGRNESRNEENQVTVAQETQSPSVAESFNQNDSAFTAEPEAVEADPINSFRTKETELIRKNKSAASASAAKKPAVNNSEKSVKSEVSKVTAPSKTTPKNSEQKTVPKENINSRTVIIVGNSGLTRPRVISNRSDNKSRQSSASEIDRFFKGDSSSKSPPRTSKEVRNSPRRNFKSGGSH